MVLPSLSNNTTDSRLQEGRVIYLMVKIYKDGALTPWIGSLKTGKLYFVAVAIQFISGQDIVILCQRQRDIVF